MLAQHYAEVSRGISNLELNKHLRKENNIARSTNCKNHPICQEQACKPFSRTELETAINKMKGKAAGPDGITPRMIKELPDSGKKALLAIINLSWVTGRVPTQWRRANIIALPKPGKPKDKPASYRPISLTSCLCKTAERMIQARMMFILESNDILCQNQAGFRKGRSTEEQIARVSQDIFDGLERKPRMGRTIMVAVDMTAAYDKVNKLGLINKMAKMNIPSCFLNWFHHFLQDRRCKVLWGKKESKEVIMKDGLPQGSVISPLLWLCYINDISQDINTNEIKIALYADDIAIYCTNEDINRSKQLIQTAIDKLQTWTKKWGMKVSVEKTNCILFTTDPKEVNGKLALNLQFNGNILPQTSSVKFLGVTIDNQLTFKEHAANVKKKVNQRLKIARALSGKSWGSRATTLRQLYHAFIEPVTLYGASTYVNFASNSNKKIVETTAKSMARIITGCTADTNSTTLMHEAEIRSITSKAEEQAAILYEKISRHPTNIPAKETASKNPQRRLIARRNANEPGVKTFRPTWRDVAKKVIDNTELKNLPRENTLIQGNIPPWTRFKGTTSFNTEINNACNKSESQEQRRRAAENILENLPPANTSYYTDGSAEEGTMNGGAGIIKINQGNINSWNLPTGRYTSSFRAEMIALQAALQDALNDNYQENINFFTDSLSTVITLMKGANDQTSSLGNQMWHLIHTLENRNTNINIVWIPGHAGIQGNDLADAEANNGRLQHQLNTPIDLSTAKAVIKRYCRNKWTEDYNTKIPLDHPHPQLTGGRPLKPGDFNRKEEVVIHQLRTNHCPLLNSTLHKWGKPDCNNGNCLSCGVPEDSNHFFNECTAFTMARLDTFGSFTPDPKDLQNPNLLVQYLRRTGRLKRLNMD